MRNKFIISASVLLLASCSNNIVINESTTPVNTVDTIKPIDNSSNINLEKPIRSREVLDIVYKYGNIELANIISNQISKFESEINTGEIDFLSIASRLGKKELVEILLKNRDKLKITDEQIYKSLLVSIENGHKEIYEILKTYDSERKYIDEIISKKEKRIIYSNLLLNSAITGNIEIAKKLIDSGADINQSANISGEITNNTPLTLATKYNHIEMVHFLISKGARLEFFPFNLLENTIKNDNKEMLNLLMLYGIDLNSLNNKKMSALCVAIENKKFELANILMDNGADINFRNGHNKSILGLAIESGNNELVLRLVQREANINDEDTYIYLSNFIKSGNKDLLELFFKYGSDINVKVKDNNTLLMEALKYSQEEIAELLIVKDSSNINDKNKNGDTALMFAVSNKNLTPTIINKLLHKGSNINYENNQSETALIFALKNEQSEIAMLLINNGADINVLDMDHNTPLILAVKNRDISSIKLMLEKDVDKDVQNNKNETAISYAKKYGYTEIVSLIEQN
jgi:ankyrin repeat protein